MSQIFIECLNSKLTALTFMIFLCNSTYNYSACGTCKKSNANVEKSNSTRRVKTLYSNLSNSLYVLIGRKHAIETQLVTAATCRLRGKVNYEIVH